MKAVRLAAALWLTGIVACSEGIAPVRIASITVSSAIGDRVAVGRTAQLRGEARTTAGDMTSVTLAWSSSAATIASVNGNGLVTGLRTGTATVTALASGVTGDLTVRVIAAELDAIAPALHDPFTNALVSPLSAATKARLTTAITRCTAGAVEGNFSTIEGCIASARAEMSTSSDPNDRALLATLALFFDHVERLLG